MKKRVISLVLTVATLLGVSGAACAVEPYASYTLDDYYVTLNAKGDSRMNIAVIVNGVGVTDKLGVQMILIEYKTSSNDSWHYYESLYGADNPDFYVYGERSFVKDIPFDGEAGDIYRVTVTAYAKKGSLSDTGSVTSGSATCY